jgi:hypothetical protein
LIVVVNKHRHRPTPNDWYCGRGSPLGNPFGINENRTRSEAIALYKPYLLEKIKEKDKPICNTLNNIWREAKRGDVYLVCYCKPLDCHCDFIKTLIDEKLGSP